MASAFPLSSDTEILDLINPTNKQNEFLDTIADHDFVLYGGAAGGGKSYMLRWWLVVYLWQLYKYGGITKPTVALFCEDYPSLQDRQVSKIRNEFPRWLGRLKRGDTLDFTLHERFGGGVIALRNLDDPAKYASAEFAAIAVDELTKNDLQTFNDLRFRLRWPGIQHPKFAGATNPGGKGHAWVKALWIERQFPQELRAKAHQFAFVQAKAQDNPHLNESYYQDLLTLPPEMARRFAEGDWNVFAGQYFTNFSESRHVKRAGELDLKPWWPRWISGDWGFDHPACFHWHARDGDHVYTYREFYGRQLGEADIAERLAELSGGERISRFFFSPDAFAKKSNQNTIAEQIGDALHAYDVPRPQPADNDRIGGWRLMYQLLDADLWTISSDCPHLIKQLPTLIRDEDDLEDILKIDWQGDQQEGDDAADCARYGLKTMLSPRDKPREIQRQERLDAVRESALAVASDDLGRAHTFMALADRQFSRDWKKRIKPITRTKNWRNQ